MNSKPIDRIVWIVVALIVAASVGLAASPQTFRLPVLAQLATKLPSLVRDSAAAPLLPSGCAIDETSVSTARDEADETFAAMLLETGLIAIILVGRAIWRIEIRTVEVGSKARERSAISLFLLAGFLLLLMLASYGVTLNAMALRIAGCETYSSRGFPTTLLPTAGAALFPLMFALLAAQSARRITRSLKAAAAKE